MNHETENVDLISNENEEAIAAIEGEEKICPECWEPISKRDKHELCKACRQKARKAKAKEWWEKYGPFVVLGISVAAATIGTVVLSKLKNQFLTDDDSLSVDDDFEDDSSFPYYDDLDADTDIAADDELEDSSNLAEAIIYVTNEWNGYGKQNYYRNIYKRVGDEIRRYKGHRYKSFDRGESLWNYDEQLEDSWDIDDLSIPEWLKNKIT